MADTFEATYTIFLTDADQCATAQAAYPSGITGMSPNAVAALYGIAVPLVANGEGDAIWTLGNAGGTAGLTEAVSSVTIPANFIVDSFFNLYAFAGAPGGTLSWRGYFLRRGAAGTGTKEALQTHRWMVGFDRALSENLSGSSSQRSSRDAARTLEGGGLAIRSYANEVVTATVPTTGTGFPTKSSWERFYCRLRKYPTANEEIWHTNGSIEAGPASLIQVTPTGQVALYNCGNQAFPGTLVMTGGNLPLNRWARVDILLSYKATGGAGGMIVLINGVEAARMIGSPAGGIGGAGGLLNQIQNHASSAIGNENTPSTGLEADVDDWTNKTQPLLFTGDDWNNGTHIIPLMNTGFGPNQSGGWTGDFRTLDGQPMINLGQTDSVDSSTANAVLEVTTDYIDRQIGCSGLQVTLFAKTASGTTESLGYGINGGAAVMRNITTSSAAWGLPTPTTDAKQTLYSAGGQTTPAVLTSVVAKYVRDAVANSRQIQALSVSAEYIGRWGDEDQPNSDSTQSSLWPQRQGPHNSPYPDLGNGLTYFGGGSAIVEVMSGVYTGNGTGQDINLQMPAHWIWIRPLTGGTGGARWWSSMQAGHDPIGEAVNKSNLVRCFGTNPALGAVTYKFRVSGANANSNANGVVYQWCAVSDPNSRYILNGAYLTASATASFTHNLFLPGFTPTAGFVLPELGTNSGTTGLYFKGPGSATTGASIMDSAESATVVQFNTGSIVPKTIVNLTASQTSYSLWRKADSNGVTGNIEILTYTGDGTGARVIALALGGRVPTFTLVQPNNGTAYTRDPSETGTNSHAVTVAGGSPSTTAITAVATNQMTVGATLNANGIVYSVLAIAGQATNPGGPIVIDDPPLNPPINPNSFNGWWTSGIRFTGAATLTTYPPTNPHDARDWTKISIFANGNAGFYGGSPAPGCTVDNFFYYAGNDYQVNSGQPTIRIFDGESDRSLITIPDVAGVKTIAIMSMLAVETKIYLTTLDSGTSAADWTGRVFLLDPIALTLTQLGSQFTAGEAPYALAWHMNRLWLGTNKQSGAAAKVYFFRPGIDTAWTLDHTLTTDSVGGAQSMISYKGLLYVGCNATAAMGTNKIVVRDTAGAWTTSFTATSAGTFRASNGFPAMCVFNDNLYVSFWNPDTVADCYIKKFDGNVWTTVYSGASGTLRPFIALFVAQKTLFAVGGGSALTACLISTPDGTTWTDLSGFLTGSNANVTALPIVGQIGA